MPNRRRRSDAGAEVRLAARRIQHARARRRSADAGHVERPAREAFRVQLDPQAAIPYPEGVADFLRGKGYEVLEIPALSMALELGEQRCANVILLGLLSTRLSLSQESWRKAIEQRFPEEILDLNLRAFEAGARR